MVNPLPCTVPLDWVSWYTIGKIYWWWE